MTSVQLRRTYFASSETKFSLKTQEDLFHELFIFSLFVTVSIMSCISGLGCRVASLKTRQEEL